MMHNNGDPPTTTTDDDGSERRIIDEILAFVDTLGAPSSSSSSSRCGRVTAPVAGAPTSPEPLRPLAADGDRELDARSARDHDVRESEAVRAVRDRETEGPTSRVGCAVALGSTAVASPTVGDLTALPQKRRRRRRDKEELDYLRVHVRELEDELQRLQRCETEVGAACAPVSRQNRDGGTDNTSTGNDGGSVSSLTVQGRRRSSKSEWEDLARRQKAAVQMALLENIQLRTLLEGQLSIARALETALQRRELTAAEVAPYFGGNASGAYADLDTEEQIYESLERGLDDQYAALDSVFKSCRLSTTVSMETITKHTDVRADAQGMYLEYREVRVLPFRTNAVGQIAWETLCEDKFDLDSGICITRGRTEDTASIKIVDACRSSSSKEMIVTSRSAVKRFVDEDRVAFVGEALVETVFGHGCLRQRERVWTLVRRIPGELDDKCEAMACIHVRPEMTRSDSDEDIDIGTLTNLVVSSYKRNFGGMVTVVSNRLMTDQLGQ